MVVVVVDCMSCIIRDTVFTVMLGGTCDSADTPSVQCELRLEYSSSSEYFF